MEQQKTRSNSEGEGEGEEDDNQDDIDLADIGSLSIINDYRVKTENLQKELKEKDTKLKLLQNECESLLKISKL